MKIDEILNFEPKVNVQMLIFLFLNAVAFDSIYWMIEVFVDSGEVITIKLIAYVIIFIVTLTAFKLEFKRLNKKCNLLKMMDDLGVGYPARNWKT